MKKFQLCKVNVESGLCEYTKIQLKSASGRQKIADQVPLSNFQSAKLAGG